ncbi:hypothetical protein IWW36_000636 [Coemansia brasiliensis]|uniref:Superoxide dismutase [Cu-Zn] n=1 Tax=Coemansia brasiliensis TaxID=2650707 RepID=A0A9W8IAZ6_9FUNG|nr:hypothetical protein IWW36_000636 [Coemansia brasiliensis]
MVSALVLLKGAVSGLIMFSQEHGTARTKISGGLSGLAPGKHGLHIHESGDITSGCTGAGPHYNPFNHTHGSPTDANRHVGDLGNIVADEHGVALFNFTDSLVSLAGQYSVIGRAVVVHADEDDLGKGGFTDSLTTGHAGGRVACGVISVIRPN